MIEIVKNKISASAPLANEFIWRQSSQDMEVKCNNNPSFISMGALNLKVHLIITDSFNEEIDSDLGLDQLVKEEFNKVLQNLLATQFKVILINLLFLIDYWKKMIFKGF